MNPSKITAREFLKRAITAWQETRGHTLSLLMYLSDAQLIIPFPRPLFNSFGKQFQELGVIQEAYIDAVQEGKMDFSKMSVALDEELVISKDKLYKFLTHQDSQLIRTLNNVQDPYQLIDWHLGSENPTLLEHIYWLIQHETLHHGQLVVYCYLLNIIPPKKGGPSPSFNLAINLDLSDRLGLSLVSDKAYTTCPHILFILLLNSLLS